MRDSRLELHNKLVELLGSSNVYYQPPENLKIKYPCIIYSKDKININYANNTDYILYDKYSITVIDKKPDNKAILKILKMPLASYDRHYTSDNLNHDVVSLYFH